MVKEFLDHYEEKYVAYLDFIGFREKIKQLDMGNADTVKNFQAIMNTFLEVEVELRATNRFKDLNGDNAQFAAFSDCMALSTASNLAGLTSMLTRITGMSMHFMRRGFFVRGGIAKGRIFHRENQIFGGALVEAVDLEQKLARYPRIVLSAEVVHDIHTVITNPLLEGWRNDICITDRDGVNIITPFFPYYASNGAASGTIFIEDHIREIAEHVQTELQRFRIDDERRAKLFWLKEQINDTIVHWQNRGQLGQVQKIEGQ